MKKYILTFALLIGIGAFINPTTAQNINVNINIGRQPAWGPVGYDYVGFYYFPDIDCYYDVNIGVFHYYDRGRWLSSRYLPHAYSNYDLYGLYKVVLNVTDPWKYHRMHRRDYARYKGHRSQIIIRDSRDHRYYSSRSNRIEWHDRKPSNNQRYSNNKHSDKNSKYNNRGNSSHQDKNKNKDSNYNSRPSKDNSKRYSRNNENKKVERSTNKSSSRMASNTRQSGKR